MLLEAFDDGDPSSVIAVSAVAVESVAIEKFFSVLPSDFYDFFIDDAASLVDGAIGLGVLI